MLNKNPIKILLKGSPISTQHAYGQRGNRRYMKTEAKLLKQSYIDQIKEQYDGPIILDKVGVYIDLFFGDRRKRDWDNRHKLSMDALEGTVLLNDNQIMNAVVAKKIERCDPCIEVTIVPHG